MEQPPAIVILLRYSVLKAPEGPKGGFLLSKENSYEDYRKALFDPVRLKQRLTTLRKIVLPSLLAQNIPLDPSRHCLAVMISSKLPANALKQLQSTVAPYPWIMLRPIDDLGGSVYADTARAALEHMGVRDGLFATGRLDDDDALARGYLKQLGRHTVQENVGKAVSFSAGFAGRFDQRTAGFTAFYKWRRPFSAQGLAAVHRLDDGVILPAERPTIYDFGKHGAIGTGGLPHIVDDAFVAYLRSVYPEQDSAARTKRFPPVDRVPRSVVEEHVGLAPESGLRELLRRMKAALISRLN